MKDFLLFREKKVEVFEFENTHNIKLPPIYKSFITNFKPYFDFSTCLDESDGTHKDFMTHIYSSIEKEKYNIDDDELSFESFIDLEDLMKYESQKQYVNNFSLIPISYHGHGGGLFVGLQKNNLDKIFYAIDSFEFELIADNIFELLSKFRLVTVDYDFKNLDTNKLYKNWHENFWRLKKTLN
ncbi:SMI1/KNR4 family protein [uncultured Tenacibaculum sp.]|uniref:SMI1/KNR4 family protein n=1 Tax=uncultured Tenacibaculum sp. TaxID=174713 RepID=UPI00260FF6A1|nr:SMI1/KNR4 family protein [uncultured Tenacibaculum sp.]